MRVGDLVRAVAPKTVVASAKPVVDVGFGTKHLVGLDLDPAVAGELTATAHRPIWVEGRGWTPAGEVRIGDLVKGGDGAAQPVPATADFGWWDATLVYDLNVADVHVPGGGGRAGPDRPQRDQLPADRQGRLAPHLPTGT